MKIGIIDLGFANINSISRALQLLEFNCVRLKDGKNNLVEYDKIIFPGVGNFKKAVNMLLESGLFESLQEYCNKGGYFLGICLGMHLLCDYGEEGGGAPGLGIIPGKVSLITPHS